MKASEFLQKAWSYIDRRDKWVQGTLHRRHADQDRYCMVGSMDAAMWALIREGADPDEVKAARRGVHVLLRAQLNRRQGGYGGIESYNDSHTYESLAHEKNILLARLIAKEAPLITLPEPEPEPVEQKPKVVRAKAEPQAAKALQKELA